MLRPATRSCGHPSPTSAPGTEHRFQGRPPNGGWPRNRTERPSAMDARIAALDPADLPDILLHVEGRACALGPERLDLQLLAPNEVATRHLLGRGFRLDP